MNRSARTCFAAALFRLLAGAQDFSDITFGKLADGYRFTEGPAWSKDGYLIFSDTPSDRLLRWAPGHATEVFRADAHGPSGNAFDADGRLYTCETRLRRVTRADKKGKIEVLAEQWEGKRLNAPSDIVVSKSGHVYFTDPAFGEQSDHRELDFYGVYHLPPKGPMKLVARPAGRPRGVALSPNGRILYVSNADEHNIRADEKGNLYVAAKGIAVYSAEGRAIHVMEMKELPSNCAFGEADDKSLFITARGLVYRVRLDVKGAMVY